MTELDASRARIAQLEAELAELRADYAALLVENDRLQRDLDRSRVAYIHMSHMMKDKP